MLDESGPRAVRNSARVEARELVSRRTRELANARGLKSIRSLADASGLGRGTVAEILAGNSDPTLSTMLALVRALGLGSIEELLSPLGTSVVIGTPHERSDRAQ
jgi:DNA-binding phage protein